MRFDEHWIGDAQLAQTALLASSTGYLEGEAVEIGAWQGLSTVMIAKAVAPSVLHVVDHWLGHADIARVPGALDRDNYAIFLANMAEGTDGNFEVHKQSWQEWVKTWDKPIRFLHLDADHATEEVRDNLIAVLPFTHMGTILCGDDWDYPSVAEGVHQVFPDGINQGAGKLWWKVVGSASGELEGVPMR